MSCRTLLLYCCVLFFLHAASADESAPVEPEVPTVDLEAIDEDMRRGRYDAICAQIEGLMGQRHLLDATVVEELHERWQVAAVRAVLAVREPVHRFVALSDLDEHHLFQIDNPRKRLIGQEIDKLKDHRLVMLERAVIAQYRGLMAREDGLGSALNASRGLELADRYEQLAKRFPDSPTGAKAAAAAERLRQRFSEE